MRNLALVYEGIKLGVYIQGVSGKLYTVDEWSGQETANGVAVCTENCSFVIAKGIASKESDWGGADSLVSNITTTTDLNKAISDYSGEENTTAMVNQMGSNSCAYWCKHYTFPNGKNGYLGAAGEWKAALDNKASIDSALNKCVGEPISTRNWTSTQGSYTDSYAVDWSAEAFYFSPKTTDYSARAFTSL